LLKVKNTPHLRGPYHSYAIFWISETFEVLNKKFGVGWNIVIGKAFHSEFQAVKGTVLMMYYQGVYGIHIWKSEK
jgi:hypothetical protein